MALLGHETLWVVERPQHGDHERRERLAPDSPITPAGEMIGESHAPTREGRRHGFCLGRGPPQEGAAWSCCFLKS